MLAVEPESRGREGAPDSGAVAVPGRTQGVLPQRDNSGASAKLERSSPDCSPGSVLAAWLSRFGCATCLSFMLFPCVSHAAIVTSDF